MNNKELMTKVSEIIDIYLNSKEVYPDRFTNKYFEYGYKRFNSLLDKFKEYDKNKYDLFINELNIRKTKFIQDLLVIGNKLEEEGTIDSYDIESISGISMKSFTYALNKKELSKILMPATNSKLVKYCKSFTTVNLNLEQALEIKYNYKGYVMQTEELLDIYAFLLENNISTTYSNITSLFNRQINSKLKEKSNVYKK